MPSAVVVGAGVFGSSIARELARRDWQVTLVDKLSPGHAASASGAESRLIRFGHGEDVWYTRSAWRARHLWRELERDAGRSLLVETGLVWFARRDDGWDASSEAVLRDEGIPCERLAVDEVAGLYPDFAGEGLEFGLLEPGAGVLRAREATTALAQDAERSGARYLAGEARPEAGDVTVAHERLRADYVVWACGAWLAGLFPGLVDIRVTKQDVLYFAAPPSWSAVPAWVDYDGAVYGHGDIDGLGVKVAPDEEGPPFDPDLDSRVSSETTERAARAALANRFPALARTPVAGGRTCGYALTVDTNFIVAPHPDDERVWIVGGGSGHGFKHGPALGEYVASLLEGAEQPDPRFGLEQRRPATGLRTAGGQPA